MPSRPILEGILWVLRSGARWKDMPERFPSYQTCHRRFQEWQRSGLLMKALQGIGKKLDSLGRLDIKETFIDGTFSSAKKGVMRGKDEARKRH